MARLGSRHRRVPASARARDAVPRLLRRLAVHARLLDDVGLAARGWHRPHDDRHVVLGGARLHAQVLLGTRRRPREDSGDRPRVRSASQLAAGRPGRYRGRPPADRAIDAHGPSGCARRSRAAGRVLVCDAGHRAGCLAHRIRAAGDAGRHGRRLPARIPRRDHGRECRRAMDRRRAGLRDSLCRHGGLCGRRNSHHALYPRATAQGVGTHDRAGAAGDRLARAQRAPAAHRCATRVPGSPAPWSVPSWISSAGTARSSPS